MAILPVGEIGPALEQLFSRFDAYPLAQQHGARLLYGYTCGPFPSIDKLIAAVANDLIERYPPPDSGALDRLPLFQLEPERPALRQRYEQAKQLHDASSKDLSAQRVGIDSPMQAEIDQLTAVVDHDLGGGLTSLKAAIDQALEQLASTAKHKRAKLTWMAGQVVLCTAWQRSIAELGKGGLIQPRTIDIGRWLHTHLPLLCQQLDPQLRVDTNGVATPLQAQLDPQPLLAACLHMILAAGKAGARSLTISSEATREDGSFRLIFQDDGEPEQRLQATQPELPAADYQQLTWLYQNLSLVRRILEQQSIAFDSQQQDGMLQIIWHIPGRPAGDAPIVLPLPELRGRVEQLEYDVARIEAQLRVAPAPLEESHPERLQQVLLPFVHELVESLRSLSDKADKLQHMGRAGSPMLRRVQPLSLYCYLLVRNLALALEGEVLPVEEVNVNEQIRQVIDLLDHKLTHIDVDVDGLRPGLPPIAIAPVEIKQVLMNLVKNAAEAIVDTGRLAISTSERHGQVVIRITDSGAGIAPEHHDRIFRLNFSTKGKGANSGVGLYAVQSIVQGAGGYIAVASRALDSQRRVVGWVRDFDSPDVFGGDGTGTLFEIVFPAVLKQGRLVEPSQPQQTVAGGLSAIAAELTSIGLIKEQRSTGRCIICNPIYARAFRRFLLDQRENITPAELKSDCTHLVKLRATKKQRYEQLEVDAARLGPHTRTLVDRTARAGQRAGQPQRANPDDPVPRAGPGIVIALLFSS